MTKSERNELLRKLASRPEGRALGNLIREEIDGLKDITKMPSEDFEIHGKANVIAIATLERIFRALKMAREENPKITKNPYE